MYPYERSLVKRLENKPFALLGVNSDQDREAVKSVMHRENITWRSWWDGGSTHGPIATKWQIESWPSIYVLDHKGKIRYSNLHPENLDRAVDKLLKEVEKGT
jgi:hypothetical protein